MAIPDRKPISAAAVKVLWGGTFDPIHQGHVSSAIEVSQYLGVKPLQLLPNSQPAHRRRPVANAEQRVEMLSLAIAGHDELAMDTREIERQGLSLSLIHI